MKSLATGTIVSAADISSAVSNGEMELSHATDNALLRIDSTHVGEQSLNAVVHRDDDYCKEQILTWDSDVRSSLTASTKEGERRLLFGVPVLVKDNIATTRMPTSCGSAMLRGYVSPFEASAITKLRNAGAIVVGKTNMDEFGMGSSTEHSVYGATRNPHDLSRVPGGSSGGSAAAVAAGIVTVALGSETGGSVRQPAAFCGITGIKPTYGRVSRKGLVAYASSLDQIGVFGRTVHDAALLLTAIAGHDASDSTSSTVSCDDYTSAVVAKDSVSRPLAGMVVGVPREYFPAGLDEDIATRVLEAAQLLKSMGAELREVTLPHTEYAIPAYYIIAPAEASSNLSRYDGVRFGSRVNAADVNAMYEETRDAGFGAEVRRRILIGTYALSAGYYDAYYKRAQAARRLITADFMNCFAEGVDVLLTPTTPTTAFELASRKDPYEMYLSDVFTVSANLAGLPAMSVPVGTLNELPVGAQLIAPHFAESTMIRIASALELLFPRSAASVGSGKGLSGGGGE